MTLRAPASASDSRAMVMCSGVIKFMLSRRLSCTSRAGLGFGTYTINYHSPLPLGLSLLARGTRRQPPCWWALVRPQALCLGFRASCSSRDRKNVP